MLLQSKSRNLLILNNNGIGNSIISWPALSRLARMAEDVKFWQIHTPAFDSSILNKADKLEGYSGSVSPLWRRFLPEGQEEMLDFISEKNIGCLLNLRLNVLQNDVNYFNFQERLSTYGIQSLSLYSLGDEIFHQQVGLSIQKLINNGAAFMDESSVAWVKKGLAVLHGEANRCDEKIVALFMSASQKNKKWPIHKWKALVRQILEKTSFHVHIFPGTHPHETGQAQEMASTLSKGAENRIMVKADLDMDQFIISMDHADVIITNDSFPSHLGAAMGIPTITLFLSTSSKIWRPLAHASHIAVQSISGIHCDRMKQDGNCALYYEECNQGCERNVETHTVFEQLLKISQTREVIHGTVYC